MCSLKGWATWLVLFLAISAALCNDKVVQKNTPCASGCTIRGNCNADAGRCECRWGYTGATCEVDRMAACRQTPDDPGSCGNLWPKHCDCYKECHDLYCRNASEPTSCTHEIGGDLFTARCWRYKDPSVPLSSLLPDDFKSETIWYQHYARSNESYDEPLEAPKELWGLTNWDSKEVAEPLSRCEGTNRCSNGRGVCVLFEQMDRPICVCHKGYIGYACEQDNPNEACWFSPNCSGRGTCHSGFCHCQPGYFGLGCHRSAGYQPETPGALPDVRPRTKLKIYMYDLPWDVAFAFDYNDGQFGRDPMYKAYEYFLQYFLQDTVVRTENPYEANLFYIPMLLYFYIGNVRDPVPHVMRVLEHVKTQWPFYNRSGGRDHFYFMTGDRGTCSVPRWMQDQSIKVVHFGMQRSNSDWSSLLNKEYACVQVKRDLVVPPINLFAEVLPVGTSAYYQWLRSTGGHDSNRTLLFFFAGGVGSANEYSGGARQAIKNLLDIAKERPPDVQFVEGRTGSYRKLLMTSKFCIAPYGYGWGLRLVQAIEFGCIPIIIQDHVYQAFEDFMPYEKFSVRMPISSVGHMVELLRAYTDEQLAALRLGMADYYRAFIWPREHGGLAYEWTLAGLQRRVYNLEGEYFDRVRRSRRRGD